MFRNHLVYISGPITATALCPDLKYNLSRFNSACVSLFRMGFSPISPVVGWIPEETGYGIVYDEIMKMDLEILTRCDSVLMLKGWELSRGATKERALAKQLNKEVLYEEEFFSDCSPKSLYKVSNDCHRVRT